MQKTLQFAGLMSLCLFVLATNAQYRSTDSSYKKCYLGSSLFMLANLIPGDNPPGFIQLNIGYRISSKDVLSLELKTWKYAWSLGIPYGNAYESPAEKFPGYIREKGFAFAYQHFWWKGLYTGIHVMNAWQTFRNEEGKKIDNGFQVFNTYRLGYHIKLFKDLFFIEPSVAATHRPYHTAMPDAFKQMDDRWPRFFWGEPGLHFGVNF